MTKPTKADSPIAAWFIALADKVRHVAEVQKLVRGKPPVCTPEMLANVETQFTSEIFAACRRTAYAALSQKPEAALRGVLTDIETARVYAALALQMEAADELLGKLRLTFTATRMLAMTYLSTRPDAAKLLAEARAAVGEAPGNPAA